MFNFAFLVNYPNKIKTKLKKKKKKKKTNAVKTLKGISKIWGQIIKQVGGGGDRGLVVKCWPPPPCSRISLYCWYC